MSNPLRAILTFHLKNGKEYTDENAVIEKIDQERLTMSSMKPYRVNPEDMDNATIMILHGNSSRLLFSVSKMENAPEYRKNNKKKYPDLVYNFIPPQPKTVPFPGGEMVVPCSGYSKLQAITKPKNLKAQNKAVMRSAS